MPAGKRHYLQDGPPIERRQSHDANAAISATSNEPA
jgi:hypothetical protein